MLSLDLQLVQGMTIPYSIFLFTGLSVISSYSEATLLSGVFGWLALVRILNRWSTHLPFKGFIQWAHAMSFEVLAFLAVGITRFLPFKSKSEGDQRPILLVHGYLCHGKVWFLQKRWLRQLGLGPIYFISLGNPFKPLREYAETIRNKVEEIAKETGREDLILVGHSMGGLLSSWYATKMAKPNTVTDVITIASPLKGTPMAHLGLGRNAREMLPKKPFILELQEAMQSCPSIRFHHMATSRDQIVVPGLSALISGNNQYVFDDLGHASLLFSKKTAHKIHEWVSGN